jgi:hypothetical protein
MSTVVGLDNDEPGAPIRAAAIMAVAINMFSPLALVVLLVGALGRWFGSERLSDHGRWDEDPAGDPGRRQSPAADALPDRRFCSSENLSSFGAAKRGTRREKLVEVLHPVSFRCGVLTCNIKNR